MLSDFSIHRLMVFACRRATLAQFLDFLDHPLHPRDHFFVQIQPAVDSSAKGQSLKIACLPAIQRFTTSTVPHRSHPAPVRAPFYARSISWACGCLCEGGRQAVARVVRRTCSLATAYAAALRPCSGGRRRASGQGGCAARAAAAGSRRIKCTKLI